MSLPRPTRLGLAFVVCNVDAPTPACSDIVNVEAAHRPPVQVQTDRAGALRRDPGDVNVVWVGDETRHGSMAQQNGATTHQLNIFVGPSIRRQPHVAAFLQDAFDYADDAPASMIVDRRPLAWEPDDRVQGKALVGGVVDEVPRIGLRVTAEVLGLQKRARLFNEIKHQRRQGKHAIGWVGLLATHRGGLGDEGLESGRDHGAFWLPSLGRNLL